jgi:hypothetical protein
MNVMKSQQAAFSTNVNLSMRPPCRTVAIELDWARKTGYDKTKIQY